MSGRSKKYIFLTHIVQRFTFIAHIVQRSTFIACPKVSVKYHDKDDPGLAEVRKICF